MKIFSELKSTIEAAEKDAAKFYEKGNASAGTRLRKAMQLIKAKAQDIRYDVSAKKK